MATDSADLRTTPSDPLDWAAGENAFLTSAILAGEATKHIDNPNTANPKHWHQRLQYMPGLATKVLGEPTPNEFKINRREVFERAQTARSSGEELDLYAFFWSVMAWGTVGDMRNVGGIAAFAAQSTQQFTRTLRQAADASFDGYPEKACLAFCGEGKVPRLGPAFFSKFLHFAGDLDAQAGRSFIYDDRVRVALNIVRGHETKPSAKSYGDYCARLHRWAQEATAKSDRKVTPDELEFRLYLLGKYAGMHRNWLKTELAMHRRGDANIDFDAVLQQLRGLAN